MYTRRTNTRLGSYEKQRFGGMGSRHSRRPLGRFGGWECGDNPRCYSEQDRAVMSRTIDDLEKNFDNYGKQSLYVQLVDMKSDIVSHDSWSSKWGLFQAWGGSASYYSSNDILARAEGLLGRLSAEQVTSIRKDSGVQAALKKIQDKVPGGKEDKKEEKKEEDSFWTGFTKMWETALPAAGAAWQQQQTLQQQQDLMSMMMGRRDTQPTTVVVQGGGGGKTGLYVGLGLAGLAVVVGGIFMLRGRG